MASMMVVRTVVTYNPAFLQPVLVVRALYDGCCLSSPSLTYRYHDGGSLAVEPALELRVLPSQMPKILTAHDDFIRTMTMTDINLVVSGSGSNDGYAAVWKAVVVP